jgi:hypothetical protein
MQKSKKPMIFPPVFEKIFTVGWQAGNSAPVLDLGSYPQALHNILTTSCA